MRYLDANVFIYAALYTGDEGDAARQILRDTGAGVPPAVTSVLTLDEVAWVIRRQEDHAAALRETSRLLAFPNLFLLDVKPKHMVVALGLMESYPRLRPRDALHAATALDAGVFSICSTDADFDVVPQLTRIPLTKGS